MPSSRAAEGWKQGFVLAEQAFPQLSYGPHFRAQVCGPS